MKRILFLVFLLSSVSLFAQQQNESADYYRGKTFIGGDFVVGKLSDSYGGLMGVSVGRNISPRFAAGVGGHFLIFNNYNTVSAVSVAPFVRYNFVMDGPVALYAQANLVIAAAFEKSSTAGAFWPNITAGMSYRLSDHFTAFAQMGLFSTVIFTFGKDIPSLDLEDTPMICGFTRYPALGIYYTF